MSSTKDHSAQENSKSPKAPAAQAAAGFQRDWQLPNSLLAQHGAEPSWLLNQAQIPLIQRQAWAGALGQKVGNRSLRQILKAPVLQREEDEATEDAPLDTSQLGVEEKELSGHPGQLPFPQVAVKRNAAPEWLQRVGGGAAPTVTVTINLVANPPVYDHTKSAATIAAEHGGANVAGWTKPLYNIAVPSLTANTITIDVTLDFAIDIASELAGGQLQVMQDHEFGHVMIGEEEGQAHLVDGLKSNLEGMATFAGNQAAIQRHIVAAGAAFAAAEGTHSQTFDTNDYPRMTEAFFGVNSALADLEANSAEVADLVSAMDYLHFVAGAVSLGTGEGEIDAATEAVINARWALSDDDLARLQYNEQFKDLVADLTLAVEHLKTAIPDSHYAQETLDELLQTLPDFTWMPNP